MDEETVEGGKPIYVQVRGFRMGRLPQVLSTNFLITFLGISLETEHWKQNIQGWGELANPNEQRSPQAFKPVETVGSC